MFFFLLPEVKKHTGDKNKKQRQPVAALHREMHSVRRLEIGEQ